MDNKDKLGHKNVNESPSSSNESCESFEYQADIEESEVDTENLDQPKMHELKRSESFEYQADIEESDVDAENLPRHKMDGYKRLGIRLAMSNRNAIRDNINILIHRRDSSFENIVGTDTENEIISYASSLPNITAAYDRSEETNINIPSQSAPVRSSWPQSVNVANTFLQSIESEVSKLNSLDGYFNNVKAKKKPIHERNTDDEPTSSTNLSQSAPGCSHWSQSSNVANPSLQGIESTVPKQDSSCTRYAKNLYAKKSPILKRNTDDEPKDYSMKNKKMKTECIVTSSNKTNKNKFSNVEEKDSDSESS